MIRHPTNAKPHGGNRGASIERKGNRDHVASLSALYGNSNPTRTPDNWRERLPDPATYYGHHVAQLGAPNGNGYAVGICPFHDDHNPSFGVKLTSGRGYWCCYAGCGNGDVVEFHQRLTGLDFNAAVRDLIGGGA